MLTTSLSVSLLMFGPKPGAAADINSSVGDAQRTDAVSSEQTLRIALAEVHATSPTQDQLQNASAAELTRYLVRCVDLDGVTFCLNVGFVDQQQVTVQSRVNLAIEAPTPSQTGDMSMGEQLRIRASLTPTERATSEAAEVENAVAALGKVKWMDYVGAGEAPPESLFERYPELKEIRQLAIASGRAEQTLNVSLGASVSHKIMRDTDARRQVEGHWCGPATMQMIDGGDDRQFESQASWASDLGTTNNGTSISAINHQINIKTSWNNQASRYTRHGIADWNPDRFYRVVTHQTGYFGAPWVQHPSLDEQWYPYLSAEDHDYGGHFQVGRGYARRASDGQRFAHILEPFNEPDWTSYTQRTWGPHRVKLGQALKANKDNDAFQNIGY